MISKNLSLLVLLAILSLPHIQTITVNFQKALATPNIYSSFAAGYVSAATNLTAIVSPSDLSASYSVLFWRPATASPSDTPLKNAGPFTGQKAVVALTDQTGNWRV
jgi:hypothetical protein